MYKLDLHTHSIISYDGGISADQYRKLLDDPTICLAVTDHNEISFAQELHQQFDSRVVVGEEIMTSEGEIIGLFLNSRISPKLSAAETVRMIKDQGGLVYIPHPFEKTRNGLSLASLEKIKLSIDILEIFNARTREPWLIRQAEQFAMKANVISAASSDAHSVGGFGTAFTEIRELPVKGNFLEILKGGDLQKKHAPLLSLLAPTINKIKKKIKQ